MLLAAKKTKQDGLYIICIIWSSVSALVTWFGDVVAPNIKIDSVYALLGAAILIIAIGIADIAVVVSAFAIRLLSKTQKYTKAWRISARILLILASALLLFAPVIKLILQ